MGREILDAALIPVFAALKDADPDDRGLAARLDASLPVTGPVCAAVRAAARAGVAEGWLCNKEAGGVKFSRPVKPSPATHDYSVDAVVMDRVAGPRHTHTNGEINLCFTEEGDAKFCGHRQGWVVFGRKSTHVPVVDDGKMIILYFLPGGAIEFEKPSAPPRG
jgi:uncharacterized protein DUF4863